MGLRINTNVAGLRTARILQSSTLDLNKSLERLSSGLRINRAADDAAGLAIAEGLRSIRRGTNVAARNAQDGISLVQTAEGALGVTVDILQRIRELAVQSANGTLSDNPNRSDLQAEVTQLLLQIDDIANNTEFNGVTPLNNPVPTAVTLHVGARGSQILVIGIPAAATQAGLLIPGLNIGSQALAQTAIGLVDVALGLANTQRSTFGAAQNRLEFTIQTLQIQEENSAAAESVIRDADIAFETLKFTRNQILVSAGTSILAQANVVPQTALQLLGG